MARKLEERRLIRMLVSRVARDLAATGPSLEAGYRDVTILFLRSRVSESTPRKAGELFQQLRLQLSEISRLSSRHGGDIDKVMGEKILIVFSHHAGAADAAERARRLIDDLIQAGRDRRLPIPWTGGLHAGKVISGLLGAGNRQDMTVIGDPVNAAARLESLTHHLSQDAVIASDEVVQWLADRSAFVAHGTVQVKGKRQPLTIYVKSTAIQT